MVWVKWVKLFKLVLENELKGEDVLVGQQACPNCVWTSFLNAVHALSNCWSRFLLFACALSISMCFLKLHCI